MRWDDIYRQAVLRSNSLTSPIIFFSGAYVKYFLEISTDRSFKKISRGFFRFDFVAFFLFVLVFLFLFLFGLIPFDPLDFRLGGRLAALVV